MNYPRTPGNPRTDLYLGIMLQQFSNENRLAVITYLASVSYATQVIIAKHTKIKQSTVSKHVKALEAAGLITRVKSGTQVLIYINTDSWKFLLSEINKMVD
jgi:DNA-binding MarR family transcriptional regulator